MAEAKNDWRSEVLGRIRCAFREWGGEQQTLARLVGASDGTVSGWLSDEAEKQTLPRADYMVRLAGVFGVRPEWLVAGELPRPAQVVDSVGYTAGIREAVRQMGIAWWRLVREHNLMETERFIMQLFDGPPIAVVIHRPPGQPELTQTEMNAMAMVALDEMPRLRWADAPDLATESGDIQAEAASYTLESLDESSDAESEEDDQGSQATG